MRASARTRSGGVWFRDYRELSRDRAIENAPIPPVCVIAMRQSAAPEADCVVEVGDVLAEGVLVGKADAAGSAAVHTPVPGRVAAIPEIRLAGGATSRAVVVELEGRFARSGKPITAWDWRAMSPGRIEERIRTSGVIGLSGESFPLRHLWRRGGGRRPESLVVNGVEPDAFLTATHRLLVERAAELVVGVRIAEKLLQPSRVVIGVEAGRPEAADAVRSALAAAGVRYELVEIDARYPRGQARYLLESVTGRALPSPGEPEDIGCVVAGADTLIAVYEAVVLGRPLTERVVTVSGVVKRPSNLKARLGTRIRDLVEECGGFREPPGTIVLGGPMMGSELKDLDAPLTKDIAGIVALSRRESRAPRSTACVSCGECVRVCPAGLSPVTLHKQIDHGRYEEAAGDGLRECTECGCCSFVCPAGIRLVESLRLGKARLEATGS